MSQSPNASSDPVASRPPRVGPLKGNGLLLVLVLASVALSGCVEPGPQFIGLVTEDADRIWVGPDYYANRLQDWRARDGRIESIEGSRAKPMRTLHLLTYALSDDDGAFRMSVGMGAVEPGPRHEDTWSGFLIGVGGGDVDFRISALSHHWPSTDGGLIVAVDGTGQIVVRDNSENHGYTGPNPNIPLEHWPLIEADQTEVSGEVGNDMFLAVQAEPDGDTYSMIVTLLDGVTGNERARAWYSGIDPEHMTGNVALVSRRCRRRRGGRRAGLLVRIMDVGWCEGPQTWRPRFRPRHGRDVHVVAWHHEDDRAARTSRADGRPGGSSRATARWSVAARGIR